MSAFRSVLIRKFAIFSLLAFSLTGSGLYEIISKHISSYAIETKVEMVDSALSNTMMMTSADTSPTQVQGIGSTTTSNRDILSPLLVS